MQNNGLDGLGTRPNLTTKMGGQFGLLGADNLAPNDRPLIPSAQPRKNTRQKYKIYIKNVFLKKEKKNNLCLFSCIQPKYSRKITLDLIIFLLNLGNLAYIEINREIGS